MSLENEVKSVETKVETVAAEVKKEVETVVEKVEAAVIEIKAEERLALRECELEYLKATIELQRLQKVMETKTKEYQSTVEGLVVKYTVDKAKYVFDGTINAFKKL